MATVDPVDLENLIKKWAEGMFTLSKTKEQLRIPKKYLAYSIDWKKVRFVHGKPKYLDHNKSAPQPTTQVLFRTFFTNRTGEDQDYSFRTSRVTSSTCDVVMQRCYTVGSEMNISVQTPGEVLKANAGFSKELSLTNALTKSIQKTLTWEVDSQIKVPSGVQTTAELIVNELELTDKFTISTDVSGEILVTVTNTNDNNSLLDVLEANIVEIIRNMKDKEESLDNFQLTKDVATFVSKGSYTFRYAIEQYIDLSEEDIKKT